MSVEMWKAVVGFEGAYEVSDAGRVRSIDRETTFRGVRRAVKGRVLAPLRHTGGYLRVSLWRDGAHYNRFIHALVLEAFVGPRPPRMEGAHGPGGQADNSLTNLRWATPKENQADRELHGVGRRGVKRRTRDVGARMAEAIRAAHARTGLNTTQLAKQLCLPRTTVADVLNRRTWS